MRRSVKKLEFYMDKISTRDENKKIRYIVKLDPSRFSYKVVKGERGYFDKFENVFIPEEALKIMLDELTTQPIRRSMFTLEDLYASIMESRARVRRTLYEGLSDTSITPSEEYLEKHLNCKINVIVLYVDIAGSTDISMHLSAERLTMLIKIFAQEMSYLISAYHGYVLKYAGDSVIAFFPAESNLDMACRDVINCARSMLNITKHAVNPVLMKEGYPELRIKIGIDLGENQIVKLGGNLDLLGYTMSVTAKIVELAKPWQVIIGKWVYDSLDLSLKRLFSKMQLNHHIWSYRDSKEGKFYHLYILKESIKERKRSLKRHINAL